MKPRLAGLFFCKLVVKKLLFFALNSVKTNILKVYGERD